VTSHAAVVGRFTVLEGQVDLLQGGKLPAAAAKVPDPVAPGDVIRTKSRSRAQLRFVDDSVLTLAPETRVAIADYLYDGPQGQRRAVLKIFRGLAHTVVTRLLDVQQPNFIMQSLTAIWGVRGTEWYTLLLPNATRIYLVQGILSVASSNPQVLGQLLLHDREFTEVLLNRPPAPARPLTPADLELLKRLMFTGVTEDLAPPLPGGVSLPRDWMPPGLPPAVTSPYAPTLQPHQTAPHTIRGPGQ
jgi:hypothetical protein